MLISWKVFIKQKVLIKVFSVFLRNEAGDGGGGGGFFFVFLVRRVK